MNLRPRAIPMLLVNQGRLIKTVRFTGGTYLGDPFNAIRIFSDKCVDEISILDVGAAKTRTAPDIRLIRDLASECFMPMAYGGGIVDAGTAEEIIGAGAEKVIIGTEAVSRPGLLTEIADRVGRQSVVVAVDYRTTAKGKVLVTQGGREHEPKDIATWVRTAVECGAGEVLLQDVDRDGTMAGLDLEMLSAVKGHVNVPIVVAGGAASHDDIAGAVAAGASAVAAGSIFVFYGPHRAVLLQYPSPVELDALWGLPGEGG